MSTTPSLCAFARLLSLLCLLGLGSAKESRTSETHRKMAEKHGELGSWNASVTGRFLRAVNVPAEIVSKLEHRYLLDGSGLFEVNELILAEMGVLKNDARVLLAVIAELHDEHDDYPMHHRSLWEMKTFHRAEFLTLVPLAVVSPYAAFVLVSSGSLYHGDADYFNRLFWGDGERATTLLARLFERFRRNFLPRGAFSDDIAAFFRNPLFDFLFCPAHFVYEHTRQFTDTNGFTTFWIHTSLLISQILSWISFWAAVGRYPTPTGRNVICVSMLEAFFFNVFVSFFVVPLAFTAAAAFFYFFLFPITPRLLCDVFLFVSIVAAPFVPFFVASTISWFRGRNEATKIMAKVL